MAEVVFDQASRIYTPGAKPAVDSLDLTIADGDLVVLVGPSGSGKSTALRMLAGLEPIDAGSVRIDGRDVVDVPSKDRDIAMVFQNYALYPSKTVAENMAFPLKMRGMDKEERAQRVRQAADMLGLTEYLDRKPKALSGGQRQRVAMGRAIVREPQVFLMDEPLSNLDAKMRVQTRAQIAEMQNRLEVSTVYVTHDQVEAMTMGDKVAVLADAAGSRDRLTVGVRPEDWVLESTDADAASVVKAVVDVVEELGSESYLYAHLADDTSTSIVVRGPGRVQVRFGDPIAVRPNPEALHVFDVETGQRLP